ncbi:ATP phosphoribosyltransferase [Fulvivirga sedimenti]|uniref:ATP phosphoribosyltransferase n=1 Tax=Fulvivirga sedimenti TaxID=2879465 RepID=A0A9X1HT48_9BACT|nr:ATP phosphoribosyltransferase [Fulvivirga sedimenti]MCA6075170.1 ATP phosphoribosyltransferase [Fulvivirga sedimenti]MCA6076347.1 ATP phosphoribosyltransferase [Fulvivirga sedimenti]MCA6077475.1 ATP phosphoribosyltransferase [Fulvivirga sedimenti]
MNTMLRIAVQKSGRLQEKSIKLLSECGLNFSNGTNRLKAVSYNFPAEILFLRDDDIPQYVEDQVADIGIVGENVYAEKGKAVDLVQRLNFAKCRLSIAVPKGTHYSGLADLAGKRIATTYPNIVRKFLSEKGISSDIHEISGSVEIAPGIGLAEAICDIVSTGSTLLSNGLKEVETVMKSEAVMIANPNLDDERQKILDQLIFRIKSVNTARNNKYLLLNAPNSAIEAITAILPGMKSPTITPLGMEGWSSLHSVVNEDDFWDIIDQLKSLGAQGILVIPIEKMII